LKGTTFLDTQNDLNFGLNFFSLCQLHLLIAVAAFASGATEDAKRLLLLLHSDGLGLDFIVLFTATRSLKLYLMGH
jgi:hypothetical protein